MIIALNEAINLLEAAVKLDNKFVEASALLSSCLNRKKLSTLCSRIGDTPRRMRGWASLISIKATKLPRAAFDRALAIAPEYGWVNYQLYPQVTDSKM